MFKVVFQFKVRPTILPKNTRWKEGNILHLLLDKKPKTEDLNKIIKFLSDQDTSGQPVKVSYSEE